MTRSIMVVAGEASADLLAAATLEALGSGWTAWGVGGPRLRAAGLEVVERAEALGLIGLVEVLSAVPRVALLAARLVRMARRRRPDVVLLVDMPDFNLHLGPLLRRALGSTTRVVYLGAPQAWAWRPGRARAMARWVDALACLFPFEPAFFRGHGVAATFVGHPRASDRVATDATRARDTFAVLPGSRGAELARHLPVLDAALPSLARLAPDHRRQLVVAPTLTRARVEAGLSLTSRQAVDLVDDDAMTVLGRTDVAWVASGTAVTECVICGAVPIVFYRVAPLTFVVARRLVRTPHIAMANLLAGDSLVPELVQDQVTKERLLGETHALLDDPGRREAIRARLLELGAELAGPDDGHTPAARVAALIEAR